MKKRPKNGAPRGLLLALLCAGFSGLGAQDFWFDDAEAPSGGLKASGELGAELLLVPRELADGAGALDWGNLASAKLNLEASGPKAAAIMNFKLSPRIIQGMTASSDPLGSLPIIDEFYLRAYLGPLTLETGLRKLAWGRADIQGPLDLTNPLDYTDLTGAGDVMGRKIARPMIHVSLPLGGIVTLEGVFIPSFQGHRYSLDPKDRWYPSAITDGRRDTMVEALIGALGQNLPPGFPTATIAKEIRDNAASMSLGPGSLPKTRRLDYAQGGLRLSGGLGPADFGVQYYSGHLFRPGFIIRGADELLALAAANPSAISATNPGLGPLITYTRYHQIGLDYAQVIFDFSLRAELAALITGDLAGDDGSVYNPSLAWSLGFDRDLFGFTLFVEADESIRLLNGKVNDNPALDTEAGSPLTSTALNLQLSRSFFQDRLELKFGLLWNIEAGDLYLMPSLSYRVDDVEAVLSGGIFTGKDGGELSQYRKNGYIKTALRYFF